MSVENLERAKSTKMGVSKKYSSCPLKKRPVQMVKDEPEDEKGEFSFPTKSFYFFGIYFSLNVFPRSQK